jgi:hypothetical protein
MQRLAFKGSISSFASITIATIHVLAAAGCGESRSVSVGQVSAEISLARCFGDQTDCSPDRLEAVALPPVESRACVPEQGGPLRFAWQTDLDTRTVPCESGTCQVSQFQAALAPDVSIWMTGLVTSGPEDLNAAGVFLAHYAEDGAVLSEAVIAFDVLARDRAVWYAPHVTVGSNGHPFVSAYQHVHERGHIERVLEEHVWIAEFDPSGAAVGERVLVLGREGIAQLHAGPQDGLVLAVSPFGDDATDPAVIAGLDGNGELRFAQTAMRETRVSSMFADAAGRITAIGQLSGVVRSADRYGMSQYDAHGNLVRAHDLRPQCMDPAVIGDHAGDLLLLGCPAPPTEPGTLVSTRIELEKRSASGDPIWAMHIDLPGTSYAFNGLVASGAVDDANDLYVPTTVVTRDNTQHTIVRVGADGDRCTLLPLDEPGFTGLAPTQRLANVVAAIGDELYVTTGAGVARLRL